MGARPRLLIVDDSALMREILTALFDKDGQVEVVGTAPDPYAAWNKIQTLRPDVITLDVEMPKMDGLSFLERLMRANPMPVVMVSTLTERSCETTLRALELGAVDFVTKPKLDVSRGMSEVSDEIVHKVITAARAQVNARPRRMPSKPPPSSAVHRNQALIRTTDQVIAIAASTGGTEALREVLQAMPAQCPGIVVVQHMPANFTKQFAARLDKLCRPTVTEAEHGAKIRPGQVLIAPGNQHMVVTRSGATYAVELNSDPPVGHHRPAADLLFASCARYLGRNAVGVVLTGMGADGAKGLLQMHNSGARTVAQDEASCVVFGMPREAIAAGGVDQVVPLGKVAETMLRLASHQGT